MSSRMDFLMILTTPYRKYREFTEKWPRSYSIYVLIWLTIVYLINQMDRFLVAISSKNVFKDLDFGTQGCLPIGALKAVNGSCASVYCERIKTSNSCDLDPECVWSYLGSGTEYQVLAGPAFIVIFTFCAIPLGFSAGFKRINRKLILSLSVVLWSVMTLLASFTENFGQLLATRIGLGLFESVCTPYATSILVDYFMENRRGVALGVYNWGIYIGYSLTFVFEFILEATNWRWIFRIASMPGLLVAVVLALTVLEPKRQQHSGLSRTVCSKTSIKMIAKAFLNPSLIAVCIAGGARQGAGLVFAYNIKPFVINEYCDEEVIGRFMSWVPLIGGTIGAVLGGYVSDKLKKRAGHSGRIWVLIISQFIATPFAAGSVLIPLPYNFISYLFALVVGEMWIGVCLAVVIELVPMSIAPFAVAIFLFVINNISGCVNLLLPPLQSAIGMKYALLILVSGLYCLSAILFTVTLLLGVKCGCKRIFRGCWSPERQGLLSSDAERLTSSIAYEDGAIQDLNESTEDDYAEMDSLLVP